MNVCVCVCVCAWFFGYAACEILVPQPGIKSRSSAVRAQSPNHWTTREFPHNILLLDSWFRGENWEGLVALDCAGEGELWSNCKSPLPSNCSFLMRPCSPVAERTGQERAKRVSFISAQGHTQVISSQWKLSRNEIGWQNRQWDLRPWKNELENHH